MKKGIQRNDDGAHRFPQALDFVQCVSIGSGSGSEDAGGSAKKVGRSRPDAGFFHASDRVGPDKTHSWRNQFLNLFNLELAVKLGAIDRFEREAEEVMGDSDLVILATPVESYLGHLSHWAKHLQPGTIVSDVGSVKGQLIEQVEELIPPGVCLRDSSPSQSAHSGGTVLRGGAYKPRTSPYSFQGLGREGLDYLVEAKRQTGLPVVSEILDPRDTDVFLEKADIIQIGARNMHNFELLKEVGAYDKPVLLKRGLSATIKELLLSAEYIISRGNRNVILCERGIRTFETQYRNTLDLSAVPTLKELSHLPVIVDPSHATGKWSLVAPMAKAAIAAGADGLLIEVHSNPECALCDGEESLKPHRFKELMSDLKLIAKAVGREL